MAEAMEAKEFGLVCFGVDVMPLGRDRAASSSMTDGS